MDYVIGFILGYFLRQVYDFIKRVAENEKFNKNLKTITELDEDWDWIDGR